MDCFVAAAPRNDGQEEKFPLVAGATVIARSPNKKPGLATGLLFSIRRTLSGSFVRHGGVVAVGFDIGFVGFSLGVGCLGLGAAARALGEPAFRSAG